MARDRHTRKEYEQLLRDAEEQGWRVERGEGYFKCLCPHADACYVVVPLTPSGGRTLANKRSSLKRCEGWVSQ